MRRVAGALTICMVSFAACDRSTEPDPCAGVAQAGELELAIFATPETFGAREIVFVGDTLVLSAEVSEVLGVSPGLGAGDLCEVDYGPPIPTPIEWSSSNPRVATVSTTGRVVGREPGAAVITARAPALGLSASRDVDVRAP